MLSNSKMFNQTSTKVNAPMFIYSILYDKPSKRISGRVSDHPHKLINGIDIDKEVPTTAIKQLMNIKEIQTTSSCQGTNLDLPTFLIFRPNDQSIEYVKQLADNLNKQSNVKCGYGVGNHGKYRFGVTAKLFYSPETKSEFVKWWNQLPGKIQNSLPK